MCEQITRMTSVKSHSTNCHVKWTFQYKTLVTPTSLRERGISSRNNVAFWWRSQFNPNGTNLECIIVPKHLKPQRQNFSMILICYTKLVIFEIVAIILRFKKRALNKELFKVFCTSYPSNYESYFAISILYWNQKFSSYYFVSNMCQKFVDSKDLVLVLLGHFMSKSLNREIVCCINKSTFKPRWLKVTK